MWDPRPPGERMDFTQLSCQEIRTPSCMSCFAFEEQPPVCTEHSVMLYSAGLLEMCVPMAILDAHI